MIDENLVILDSELDTKEKIIRYLAEKVMQFGYLDNIDDYIATVKEREKEFSTAIGHHVSIPHGKSAAVLKPFVCFMRTEADISWDDQQQKANLIFLLGIPEKHKGTLHLKILAEISKKLLDEAFRKELKDGSKASILKQLYEIENNIIQ